MSAQDKLDRRAAKHGLGSDDRKRKIQKAKDFFSKPVPTYSKDELRKMGHPVEQKEGRFDIVIPPPKGSNKNTDKQIAAKAARRAANRAKTNKAKVAKAMAKDMARSASGGLKRTDDHRRKNYQSGKSGAYFSKYENVEEKAVSKSQQKFMGMVRAVQKGDMKQAPSPEVAKAAKTMSKKDVKDFASTKHKGLPESSVEYGKSMDRIKDKEKNAAIKPKDRETLGKLADLMKKQKRNEAYRKPTQAEIDADKRKDGKSKDSSTRYRDMKKKVYGNAMGGLRKEETTLNLEEGLVKVTDVEFNYRDQLPNSPKTSDIGAISSEWKQDRMALRDAVKKMGGLVTNTVAPSRGNKWVGTVTIGTRGDPSKLDDKSIQRAVKRHGIEIHSNQFRESTDLLGESPAAAQAIIDGRKAARQGKKYSDNPHKKGSKEFTAWSKGHNQGRTTHKESAEENLEEQKYAVKYTHPTDKKSGKTTGPLSKAAADKKAAMGNRVDRVGGKYTVIPHVEAAGQEYTAVPIKTGDVSQADRLTIAKMDAIMKKRSKDKRQKEDWRANSARRMRNQRIANEPYRGPSEPDTRTDSERMADRAKLAKRFAADKAKQDKAVSSKKESVATADKKPQNFRDPVTGKMKVRMVPVDRDVVRGDDKARVVRKKRFKHMRKEQMATGNSHVGKDGRDAFMKAFKDIQKTAAEIQKKKDADKK